MLTGEVQYTEEMPVAVPWSLPSARPAHTGEDARCCCRPTPSIRR
ncbi:nucleoside triphosphate pyrophosphohydrolase domain protein [Mycobacterium xenopi 4042]|uniref:Nucleoside triphosphate pyrophosphohydrolase domain protein n=1 Tax=Mycobacterium xenopi 4042 TaxID=1299334 RepID=X8AFZ3_MYCXE|nr:nucleoside triphosphate pyrophosphohydrolase domain protein [Mycobacterium xenopi 4042]